MPEHARQPAAHRPPAEVYDLLADLVAAVEARATPPTSKEQR